MILTVCRKTVIKLIARKVKKRRNIYLISISILILCCFKLLTLIFSVQIFLFVLSRSSGEEECLSAKYMQECGVI